jgi:methylated-DNA-protein-cysteine methyltransferase-like protein
LKGENAAGTDAGIVLMIILKFRNPGRQNFSGKETFSMKKQQPNKQQAQKQPPKKSQPTKQKTIREQAQKSNTKKVQSGKKSKPELKIIRPSGSPEKTFFELVYEVVRQIPYGRATSYGAIAEALGARSSSRMVGYAMNNAHTIYPPVPAHRVVNRNGMLTGKHHFELLQKCRNCLKLKA